MLRRSAGLFKTKFENAAWGLELQSYGFGDHQTALTGTPAVKADSQRLSYLWDANVKEWFINEPRGLEHGFTVNERPAAALNAQFSTLNFHLAPLRHAHTRRLRRGRWGHGGPERAGPIEKPKTAPFLHRFCTAPPFCPVQFRPAHENSRSHLPIPCTPTLLMGARASAVTMQLRNRRLAHGARHLCRFDSRTASRHRTPNGCPR